MADGADAGHTKVNLEVAMIVPGDGADPVTELDAEAAEGMCKLGRSVVQVSI